MNRTFTITSGTQLRCKGWRQEGLLRLLENVLAVGERPQDLIVYASLGKAARTWKAHDQIVTALKNLEEDETLLIQSGKPIGVLKTHARAPLVIMANCNLVGGWATPENFYRLEEKGLICWGGLTAGAWQYIGTQGVIQGTYEILQRIAAQYFGGDLRGRFVLTAGLGGMGGAQPLAGVMAEAAILAVEADPEKIARRQKIGYLQHRADSLDEALALIDGAVRARQAISVGLHGNAAEIYPEIVRRGRIPDVVTDQTAAHDLLHGYLPIGHTPATAAALRHSDPERLVREALASIRLHVEAMLAFKKAGSVVFDNGNNIRSQAQKAGVERAFDIPIFTEAFLRPLFCRGIGPFRWIALSGNSRDIAVIDEMILERFAANEAATRWIRLAREHIPFQGLPARIGWFGHGERTELALEVNRLVREGRLEAPVAFSRDHLDAGAMAHPHIMTENMRDGSDAIADWPLLNAMLHCSSMADLVAIHSGGGGYSGYMTSAGLTLIADGTPEAGERLQRSLTNDTSLGVMRYADAGYEESHDEIRKKGIPHFDLRAYPNNPAGRVGP